MTLTYKDEWIDRIEAQGEAKGEARGLAEALLRVLAARGLDPDPVRDPVLACSDTDLLQTWIEKAATARSLQDVFPDGTA